MNGGETYLALGKFPHPVAFWLGVTASVVGVLMHLPMFMAARPMHYRMVGMRPDPTMVVGMALILVGLAAVVYGLLPRGAGRLRTRYAGIRVRALDEARIRWPHVGLLVAMALTVTIDVMKPTALSFVVPGAAAEYGLKTAANPTGSVPVTWLPLAGIVGTALGSLAWGWLGDRLGRRASIMLAAILFISTSICGAMPAFAWNLLMCFLMGIGAGGMLPIAFTLLAETIPARHRGWLLVLIGGDVAGAYVITSWLAGALTPTFGWRILWLIGMPTGALMLLLNRWIPESPRYLLAVGRVQAARAVMARYGATMVEQPVSRRDGVGGHAGLRSLFVGTFSRYTLGIGGLAVAAGLLTYGFRFWVPTDLQRAGLDESTADFILRDAALLGLPLTVVVALLFGLWSSRRTILALATLTAVSVLVFAFAKDMVAQHHLLYAALLALPLTGSSSVAAVVTAYGSEVYPTRVRSRGTGLIAGLTKTGGVLVLVIVLASTTTPSIMTTALLGGVPMLAAVVVFLATAPDTHQRVLEDLEETVVDSVSTTAGSGVDR